MKGSAGRGPRRGHAIPCALASPVLRGGPAALWQGSGEGEHWRAEVARHDTWTGSPRCPETLPGFPKPSCADCAGSGSRAAPLAPGWWMTLPFAQPCFLTLSNARVFPSCFLGKKTLNFLQRWLVRRLPGQQEQPSPLLCMGSPVKGLVAQRTPFPSPGGAVPTFCPRAGAPVGWSHVPGTALRPRPLLEGLCTVFQKLGSLNSEPALPSTSYLPATPSVVPASSYIPSSETPPGEQAQGWAARSGRPEAPHQHPVAGSFHLLCPSWGQQAAVPQGPRVPSQSQNFQEQY